MCQTTKEGFRRIAEQYKKEFMEQEGWLKTISRLPSVRWCLTTLYAQMVQHGELEPVEQLSKEENEKLWQAAWELAEVRQDKDGKEYRSKTEIAEIKKALHAFGTFIQL